MVSTLLMIQDFFLILVLPTETGNERANQSHDVPEQHEIRRSTDFEALKLRKGSSSWPVLLYQE